MATASFGQVVLPALGTAPALPDAAPTGGGSAGPLPGLPVVTNIEFLQAVFGPEWRRAFVTSFAGDPGSPPPGAWRGWQAGRHPNSLKPDANNYFCISLFEDAQDGTARRRKDLFRACRVIVLDDVSEKLSEAEALAKLGPPSYRLQTSPGSQQWGYFLEPETDAGRATALLTGLVKASLNPSGKDPGMTGVTRLVRLPVGRNMKAKHGPGGVACQLLEWAPERTFTVDALALAFDIDLTEPAPAAVSFKPREPGERDLVREMLDELGLVQGTTGDNHLAITCPFVEEHTGGADTGTAYLSRGGFKCHHGHCQDRKRGDFEARLDQMMREEGRGAWRAKEEFKDADKPALAMLRQRLAQGEDLTPAEWDVLAVVPEDEVDRILRLAPVLYDTDIKPFRAGIAQARLREALRWQRPAPVVALPDGYQAPVSLDEARAVTTKALAAFMATGAADTRPAGTVPLRKRRGHAR